MTYSGPATDPTGRAGAEGPATYVFPIGPSDTAFLEECTRAIWVGVAGNITLMTMSGKIATISNISAGSLIPIKAIKVYNTGTSAAALQGFS